MKRLKKHVFKPIQNWSYVKIEDNQTRESSASGVIVLQPSGGAVSGTSLRGWTAGSLLSSGLARETTRLSLAIHPHI